MFRLLFLADIVGRPGRRAVRDILPALKAEFSPDLVIANGENSAGGLGIDAGTAKEIFAAGVDIITTGNHVWNKKEVGALLSGESHRLLRPINFATGAPGVGACQYLSPEGVKIVIVNAMGRVFMNDLLDCPFQAIESLLCSELCQNAIIFIDFHAEATSEKIAMAHFLDGRVAALVGTHTHVQTADERVFPKGLAYISDVGMCGPTNGVIGVNADAIVHRFRTGLPMRFAVADGPSSVNGVVIDCDPETKVALAIKRIQRDVAA